jgi:WD40 repeat protein
VQSMMSILTARDNYSVSHIYVRASNADELALVRMFTVTCSSLFIKIWDSENEWKNTKTLVGHEHSVSSVRFNSTLESLRSLLCARISKGTVTLMYVNHGTITFPVIDVSLSAESRSSGDRRPSLPFFSWVY